MSQWIWKFGEFEAYHSLRVHSRRQQYGYPEPVVWKLYPVDPVVVFRKHAVTEGGLMKIAACGEFSAYVTKDGKRAKFGGRHEIMLDAGEYDITVRVCNHNTFPCLFISGSISTDKTWEADDLTCSWASVGTDEHYTNAESTPERFQFAYEAIEPVSCKEVKGGVLFDFGKETFAKTEITELSDKPVCVRFGESEEEAMDEEWSVIRFCDMPEKGSLAYPPYAFRYVFVGDRNARINAEYEYLPIDCPGRFESSDETLNRVWQVAKYTFHLNTREFFLDGIKRDGWVWSGDAYQSLFVNRYLFHNADAEKRTLIALAGKSPFRRHINTIIDYTFFWFLNMYEFYRNYGDIEFIGKMYPRMREIMAYCRERADADGFIRGREGDWTFIDWAPMDKTGALCGEQILFARALECYCELCALIGKDDEGCGKQAKKLQKAIIKYFYNKEKGAFIDSFESGKNVITRQSNILAYLFLPCSRGMQRSIYKNVILNDTVRQITTPYFKFYEYQVYGMEGNVQLLENKIREYYGAMLETGATTLYEEFDPTLKGAEHYAMYGHPYEKSLCHAWSASPIYLLGCYRMGVKSTGVADETFEVKPVLKGLDAFSGTVPLCGGEVRMSYDGNCLSVTSTKDGGTLIVNGEKKALSAGVTECINM